MNCEIRIFTEIDSASNKKMNSDEAYEKLLSEGKFKLMKMEWYEAEQCFLLVLQQLDASEWKDIDDSASPRKEDGFDWIRLEALAGLGEVETRRCQRFCHNDFIWFGCMFRSVTFYKAALQYLPEKQVKEFRSTRNLVQNSRPYESQELQEAAFYNQSESKIQYQIKRIENLTNVALYENILETCFKYTCGKSVSFDDDWLKKLVSFCSKEIEYGSSKDWTSQDEILQNLETEVKQEGFRPIYKRKIDYNRVQEAIMKLVNDVSLDVRKHYSHMTRLVPQKLVQQRLMLEISRRLTPGTRDNLDLLQVLENAIVYEDITKDSANHGSLKDSSTIDQSVPIDCDEDRNNEGTLYMDLGRVQSRETSVYHEYQESRAGFSFVKYPTGTSSPSCQSKKSKRSRFFQIQQLETSSSGKLSQITGTKTISSLRSIFDAGSGVPSKNSRMKNILTIWRACRRQNSIANTEISTNQTKTYVGVHGFEEISPLSEREKVLNWLKGVEEPASLKASKMLGSRATETSTINHILRPNIDNNLLSGKIQTSIYLQKLITSLDFEFTIVFALKKSAETLGKKNRHSEALEVFKFVLNLVRSISSRKKRDNETIADLLRRIGMSKCALGQISVGCQLMQESVGLYNQMEDEADPFRVCEIWYQLAGAYLPEGLRKDSLFMRVMQLIQEKLDKEYKIDLLSSPDEGITDDASDSSETSDGYCICLYEAAQCYKEAMKVFTCGIKKGKLPNTELYVKIICELADCYFMLGNLDIAEARYEEALLLFPQVRGSSTIKENSHVLSMLGSLNFLLCNFVRAATMFETSHLLSQHRFAESGEVDDTTLQKTWNIAMLGLACYNLGHFDKTVAWCTRAFTLYTRILRGSLFNADYYNHWFVVENLYCLGTAYMTMNFFEKGVYYLNLGRNLINGCEVPDRQDAKQHVKVLRALADAHAYLHDNDVALKFYQEAVDLSKKLGEDSTKNALQNQLLNRMACVNVDVQNFSVAGTNLELALGYQKDVEASIKVDMAAVLRRLGATSVLVCDVDKAIACYKDCIQAYNEMEWLAGRYEEVVKMLCTLAILYHVKSCTIDDENQVELFTTISEGCFQEAIAIAESNPLDIPMRVESCIDLQYANFLYQQGLFADATHAILPLVFCRRDESDIIVYSGIEQAVLPDHLQSDFNDDSMVVEVRVMAYFLAVICYKSLGLISDADDALLLLYENALRSSSSSFACNVCAYALMEMSLFHEACEMFYISSLYKQPRCVSFSKSGVNYWICLCVSAYVRMGRAFSAINDYLSYRQSNVSCFPCCLKKDSPHTLASISTTETSSDLATCSEVGEMIETYEEWTEEYFPEPDVIQSVQIHHNLSNTQNNVSQFVPLRTHLKRGKSCQKDSSKEEIACDETIFNHNFLESASFKTANEKTNNQINNCLTKEINGNRQEHLTQHTIGTVFDIDVHEEEWVTIEEVVDTPVEILAYLSSINQVPNQLVASS